MKNIPCKTCLKFPMCNNKRVSDIATYCNELKEYTFYVMGFIVVSQNDEFTTRLTTDKNLNPIITSLL